jgi:hypothetical protein
MKSSSSTQGLAVLLEDIDKTRNSVCSDVSRLYGANQTPYNKLEKATIFTFGLRAGPVQTRPHPFTRCNSVGQLVGYWEDVLVCATWVEKRTMVPPAQSCLTKRSVRWE